MKRASAVETFQIKLLFKKTNKNQQKKHKKKNPNKKLLWQLYMIKTKSTTLNLELKITVAAITKRSPRKKIFLSKFQVLSLDKVFFKN